VSTVFSLNNELIVNELQSNMPLLHCNPHHAMVVYKVNYVQTSAGPHVVAVGW
jgi:hypothetical protein